jgi:hypothetical protein
MTRTWKLWGLSTAAALLLAAGAVGGAPGGDGGKKPGEAESQDPKQRLKDLEKRLDENLQKIAAAFETHTEAANLQAKRLKALEASEANTKLQLTEIDLKLRKQKELMLNLQNILTQLRDDIETLQKRLPVGDISKYPPPEKVTLDDVMTRLRLLEQEVFRMKAAGTEHTVRSPPTTGRIVFENRHPQYLLFVLNRKAYRAEAGQIVTIDAQPVGTFTYEVISPLTGSGGIHTRVLEPGKTFTITAR